MASPSSASTLSVSQCLLLDGRSVVAPKCRKCDVPTYGLKEAHTHITLTRAAVGKNANENDEMQELRSSERSVRNMWREYTNTEKQYSNSPTSTAVSFSTVDKFDADSDDRTSIATKTRVLRAKIPPLSIRNAKEWLARNYEQREGISVPRRMVYSQYIDMCREQTIPATNQATFGKILRSLFPSVRTRRLGNRGKSKYHYYGLQVKSSSPYMETVSDLQRVNVMNAFSQAGYQCRTISQREYTPPTTCYSVSGMIIPHFPDDLTKVNIPEPIRKKVALFLSSFHRHCACVADHVVRAEFEQIQFLLQRFWFALPFNMRPIFQDAHVINLVALCDLVLFRALSGVMIPDVLQPIQTNLLNAFREFARSLPVWVEIATNPISVRLAESRKAVAKRVCDHVIKNTELVHFASAARCGLHRAHVHQSLMKDWMKSEAASSAMSYGRFFAPLFGPKYREAFARGVDKHLAELENLFEQDAGLAQFAGWCHQIMHRNHSGSDDLNVSEFRRRAADMMLTWNYLSGVVGRRLVVTGAGTVGAFHLMDQFLKDYIAQLLDKKLIDAEERILQKSVFIDWKSITVPADNARMFANMGDS
ncbi:regulatory factor X 4-like [Tubulanus polymorphus]|uniref:regulatory factor X 4-like n=1 Tax=Tubulanus polymorphus TaxID=672921 RepID=UPI003DA5C823